MPSNIVLECSQYESNSPTNSVWQTTFSEEISLEEGDVFQLQQALINTQTVSSGSILIEEDTTVTIQVAYYDMALGSYLINVDDGNTELKRNYPLPGGTSANFAYQLGYDATFNPTAGFVTKTSNPAGLYLLRGNGTDIPTDDSATLYTADVKVSILAGVYQPDQLAALITTKMESQLDKSVGGGASDRGVLINTTHADFADYRMVAVETLGPQATAKPVYKRLPHDEGADPLLGASTFTFEYNDNVFAFSNLHSPMMGAVGGGTSGSQFYNTPSVGLLRLGEGLGVPLKKIECMSGCLITDLQPRAFWSKLGFSSTHIDNHIVFNDATYKAIAASDVPARMEYLNSRRVRPNVLMA